VHDGAELGRFALIFGLGKGALELAEADFSELRG
jgi:hypothetical protein